MTAGAEAASSVGRQTKGEEKGRVGRGGGCRVIEFSSSRKLQASAGWWLAGVCSAPSANTVSLFLPLLPRARDVSLSFSSARCSHGIRPFSHFSSSSSSSSSAPLSFSGDLYLLYTGWLAGLAWRPCVCMRRKRVCSQPFSSARGCCYVVRPYRNILLNPRKSKGPLLNHYIYVVWLLPERTPARSLSDSFFLCLLFITEGVNRKESYLIIIRLMRLQNFNYFLAEISTFDC